MAPLFVLLVVDALGYGFAERHRVLPELAVRRRLTTVLGYSSAAIPTLLSGVPPAVHGHWAMYRRAGPDSAFRRLAPALRAAARLPRGGEFVRRRAARWIARTGRVRGYFSLYAVPLALLPYFDLVARDDLFAPGGLDAVPTLFDHLAERGVSARVWSWRDDPARAAAEAAASARDPGVGALVVYRADLDAALHAGGMEDPAAIGTLRRIEADARAVLREAASAGRAVTLVLVSDHGMADAGETDDVVAAVERTGLRVPEDYLPFYDSTMARFWFGSPHARDTVAAALDALPAGQIVPQEELERLGVGFPDGRYGELVYLMPVGRQIAPSFMGAPPRAMHGYTPADSSMDACLLSTGPGENAETILDILPALLRALPEGAGAPV